MLQCVQWRALLRLVWEIDSLLVTLYSGPSKKKSSTFFTFDENSTSRDKLSHSQRSWEFGFSRIVIYSPENDSVAYKESNFNFRPLHLRWSHFFPMQHSWLSLKKLLSNFAFWCFLSLVSKFDLSECPILQPLWTHITERTELWIWLRCICWQHAAPNTYIKKT